MNELIGVLSFPAKQALYIFQIILAEGIFAFALKRRQHFARRLCVCLVFFILCSTMLSITVAQHTFIESFMYLGVFLLSIPIFPICFESDIFDCLFCVVAGVLVQNLSNNVGVLLCDVFQINPDVSVNIASAFLQVPAYAAVHVGCYFMCAKRIYGQEGFGVQKKSIIVLLAISVLICFLLHYMFYLDGLFYYGLIYVLFVIYDVMALIVLFGAYTISSLKTINSDLEQLIQKENAFREANRHAIEIINMRAHDLKHYLYWVSSGKVIDDEYLDEIRKAVSVYDNVAQISNSVLNTVLTEKLILCEHYGITLSYTIDSSCVDHIRSADLVAVFNNILDNAIQYLLSVEEEERVITLQVFRRQGYAVIHTDNFCSSSLKMIDGLPETTNASKDYHGFGLASVRYVAQKYGGNMTVTVEDQRFNLNIIIPAPEEKTEN